MHDSLQAIKNNEARMRAIVETVLDGIITTSELGIIETVNPAILRMFVYSKEALINQPAIILISSKYRVEYAGYLQIIVTRERKRSLGLVFSN